MVEEPVEAFYDEAGKLVDELSLGLLELELRSEDGGFVNSLWRASHSLKGLAHLIGFEQIGDIAYKMEGVFEAIEKKRVAVSSGCVDALLYGTNTLRQKVEETTGHKQETKYDVQKAMSQLDAALLAY